MMSIHSNIPVFLIPALVLSLVLFPAAAVTAEGVKKPLSYDAYDSWRSIQGTRISSDGVWTAYALAPQDGDGDLVVRNLRTGQEYRHARGRQPIITADGRFVVFAVAPLKADVDKARKEKKKPEDQPKSGLGILNLETGDVVVIERVKSFKVPEDAGSHFAYLLEPPLKKPEDKPESTKAEPEKKAEPTTEAGTAKHGEPAATEQKPGEKKEEKKKDPGTELVIRELSTGTEQTVSDVVDYTWDKSGGVLAYGTSSKTPDNDGAFLWRASDGKTLSLMTGLGHYKGFTFDEKGARLAFLSDRDDYQAKTSAWKLYLWTAPSEKAAEIIPGTAKGFPAGMSVGEHGSLEFSRDSARLFFGLVPAPQPEPEDAPDPIKVDIWHWRDPWLQPMQKARAEDEKKRSFRSVFHIRDGRMVRLATPDMPDIVLSDDGAKALGVSDLPYRRLISWDTQYADYYLVNIADGSRRKILEAGSSSVSFSPAGNHLIWYERDDRNWYSYRITDGRKSNLTAGLDVRFENELHDSPSEPYPYGIAGWTEGDRTVLINDRYDIWEIRPDGSGARMITRGQGRAEGIVFRYFRLDREEKTIPAKTPILISASEEAVRKSGYYRTTLSSSAAPEKVVMLDKLFGGLQKAKAADIYLFTLQRFEEFPDLWTSGPSFADMKKISDANPQQADYFWGKAELIEYVNADGRILQAVLIKPDDFDPAKKYPLMVYIYERLSQGLHRYYPPSPGTSINFSRYVSNGYVLLMPDIVYDIGYPGRSALKCVVPAANKILEEGYIDPARVGIQGHSWGGYQISYLITQTDMFAAVQAGASVVNMTSAYGGIRWGSGMSRAFQYEKTQSRIGAPLWTRTLQYLENSPLFWADRVNTPYLTIHNDEDDAVPWYQGIEFVTALRRLDREAYMFNYNGEKHGLRERENQKHWTVHQDEFFDHFLLGTPRPEWMENGVPYLERGKRDINALFKKAEDKKD
ncbi:MAG: prolyl oligopeptidase family serine peptidase [Acidobacteriota bacterium]|nr:prolyl oligopeptidase family serine peptidase [Acidobacteriota bacterium]